jgi:hypothetical protein
MPGNDSSLLRAGERRSRLRVPLNWPVCVRAEGELIVADLRDISCGGAYCWSSRQFQTGEYVELELLLPGELDPQNRGMRLRCRGRVVRAEEIGPERYGFACIFEHYRFLADELEAGSAPSVERALAGPELRGGPPTGHGEGCGQPALEPLVLTDAGDGSHHHR